MSEEPQEGQKVESGMSAEAMAALSDPRPAEGEVPETKKKFEKVSFEDVEASCKEADEKADEREEIPKGEAEDEEGD